MKIPKLTALPQVRGKGKGKMRMVEPVPSDSMSDEGFSTFLEGETSRVSADEFLEELCHYLPK